MTLVVWRIVSSGLLLVCLASFGWAMRTFFSRPAGSTRGMKFIRTCGAAFAVLHLGAIALIPDLIASQLRAAATFYATALALFWWSLQTNSRYPLSASFSPDTPRHVVEDGPYRFIRHPFYCSYLLTWSAGVIATGSIWLLPTVVVMSVIYFRAAREEEQKFMRSPLAETYKRYQARTGQFLPNPVKMFRRDGLMIRS